MNFYKIFTAKPYSFLVDDATLASDKLSNFRKNLLERIQKLIMTTDDGISDEKLRYNINREAAKISALSSRKIDKYEYLTGEEILPSNQRQIIDSSLGKAFEKQTKRLKSKEENK